MVLKKKIGVLITLFVCLLSLIGLVSCGGSSEGNTNSSNNNNSSTTLSSEEKALVDVLKYNVMPAHKDPGSVTVTSIIKSYYSGSIVLANISAKNSLGGMVSTQYYIVAKNVNWDDYYDNNSIMTGILPKGYFVQPPISVTSSDYETQIYVIHNNIGGTTQVDNISYSVSNINSALNEYKKSQGWS